jgi:hypothetical protein
MSDLISAEFKTEISGVMKDLFDTFKRTTQITAFKSAAEVVVLQDPDYIPGFRESNQVTTDITKTSQSRLFDARIWYLDLQPLKGFVQGGSQVQTKFEHSWGRVKLQVEKEAFDYLRTAERFYIYDEEHRIDEGFRRVGILGAIEFYECILERVN